MVNAIQTFTLQFGPNDCKSMLDRSMKQKHDFKNPNLELDTWQVTNNVEALSSDKFKDKTNMQEVQKMVYLSAVSLNDGIFLKNIIHN